MIQVKSWSLGCNEFDHYDFEQKCVVYAPIYTIKNFKRYGLRCKLYIFLMKFLEDYIEVEYKCDGATVYHRYSQYKDTKCHIVSKGDCLWNIVKRYYDVPTYYYDSVIHDLCVENKIADANCIEVGMNLKLI